MYLIDHASNSATSERRIGRFSDGIERSPRSEASERIGTFADSSRRAPVQRHARANQGAKH